MDIGGDGLDRRHFMAWEHSSALGRITVPTLASPATTTLSLSLPLLAFECTLGARPCLMSLGVALVTSVIDAVWAVSVQVVHPKDPPVPKHFTYELCTA